MRNFLKVLVVLLLFLPNLVLAYVNHSAPIRKDKEEANRAFIKNLAGMLPKGAKVTCYDPIIEDHRLTPGIAFSFWLPYVMITDQEKAKAIFLPYLAKMI